jgi:hypothetical protein
MIWESPQGVWGCRLWGDVVVAPVAVASRHGRGSPVGTAAACQLVGVRQRAGAGGRWLGYGPACFYAGGQRPAAGRVRLGAWAGVAAHLAVGGAAWFLGAVLALIVASGWRVPPFPCRRSSWARPCWWRSFGGHLRQPVLSVAGWRSAATRAGSLYRLGGVLAGGGPSCAAGEVQHGEGWPWRQPMAGDPGARTAWCSAC